MDRLPPGDSSCSEVATSRSRVGGTCVWTAARRCLMAGLVASGTPDSSVSPCWETARAAGLKLREARVAFRIEGPILWPGRPPSGRTSEERTTRTTRVRKAR